jgi:protoporphyrinogen oxidase
MGVRLVQGAHVKQIEQRNGSITAVRVARLEGTEERYEADDFISTMPVRELVLGMTPPPPAPVRAIAAGLQYRDFVIIGLLYRKLMHNPVGTGPLNLVPDNWIYVQEPGVKVGRLQIFNNWSPYLVRDPDTVWIGMEYFCSEGDPLWETPDAELKRVGLEEMRQLKLAEPADHLDAVVIRMPKAYPGYFGTYGSFDELRTYLDAIPNLFLAGRNGMHRYNNQDHSMLSAKLAADAIRSGSRDKRPIWDVNIDDEYHEQASEPG